MTATKILELDLTKLQENKYNPRKTMDKKGLASLEKSLERDGQLQTILVRPIDGNKYEVVAGMRRFLSLKNLGQKKVVCTVQEMDDQTAMQRAFKENMEREALSPVDEAAWFFQMLGLKEEQLFIHEMGAGGHGKEMVADASAMLPIPTAKNPKVKILAENLGSAATDSLIELRLPLLALPDAMQRLVGKEDGIPIKKAEVLARLRLIGDKDEAQKHMVAVWKQAANLDLTSLNTRVQNVLDTYEKKADDVLKELEELERTLSKGKKRIQDETKEISDWIDPQSKDGLFQQLPRSVSENIKIAKPKKTARSYFDYLDEVVNVITRDDSLSEKESNLSLKLKNLYSGKDHIEDHECAFCGTRVDLGKLEKRVEDVEKEKKAVQEDNKTKDNLRGKTEKMKRSFGLVIREFDDVAHKYDTTLKSLTTSKKLTKEQADAKRDQFLKEEE